MIRIQIKIHDNLGIRAESFLRRVRIDAGIRLNWLRFNVNHEIPQNQIMIYNYTLHFGAFSRNVDPEDEELVLHSAQDFANAISKMLSRQDTKCHLNIVSPARVLPNSPLTFIARDQIRNFDLRTSACWKLQRCSKFFGSTSKTRLTYGRGL